MPYTCVGFVVMLVSRRWRHGVRSRVACARRRPQRRDGGSTRGTRGGGQRAGAVGVRARVAASAALAIAAVAHCVSQPRAATKAQKPRGSENRPIAQAGGFMLSLQHELKVSARAL